jgi:predicted DNA-binding transcriptional regulator AlpA
MHRCSETPIPGAPVLITAKEFYQLLKISKRHFHRLKSKGEILAPITIGRVARWDLREVEDWIKCRTSAQPANTSRGGK